MVHIPKAHVSPCKNCGGTPEVRSKLFGLKTRMECECGVSGAWVEIDARNTNWNTSAKGWQGGKNLWPTPPRAPEAHTSGVRMPKLKAYYNWCNERGYVTCDDSGVTSD